MAGIVSQEGHGMTNILFVCSGNIFRSLVAEYALKARVGAQAWDLIGSAGIEAVPQEIHPVVLARLLEKGVDPSRHVQRKLNRELIERATLPIAMGTNHQAFIRREFGREAPLFNRLCYGTDQPVLDVHEAIPDWQDHLEQSRDYVLSIIDHIWNGIPHLLAHLPRHNPR
jgi:protein-tyrosine phosphatase